MTENREQKRVLFIIIAGLVLATLVAYEPVRYNGFVSYDDGAYITENADVRKGITPDTVIRAFTKSYASNWHPLTWLSHMLDCRLFGLNPLWHHLVSVLIHITNALLLFGILRKMTESTWASAFVAAVFALHPLQVESVAWAAERKTVLSGFFWFLTIAVYIWYAKRPGIGRYAFLFVVYALCIMTKPIVVTLPLVLLILDYWPLNRLPIADCQLPNEKRKTKIDKRKFFSLLCEKIPLMVLSVILSVITFVAQQRGGAVIALENWSVYDRLINAAGSYFNYIVKTLYPKGLAVLYPIPQRLTFDVVALAVMGAVTLPLLLLWGRKKRWLVAGLLWYLVTLVPVIGIVQSGAQMTADRYAYLSITGVSVIIAWGVKEIFSKRRYSKIIPASAATAALIALALLTRAQVTYWRDTPTLFKRAIAATKNNYVMHNYYGEYLCGQGRYEEGIRHFWEAISIWPEYPLARMNFCQTLLRLNKLDEAIVCYTDSLQIIKNDWSDTHKLYQGLGWAYEQKGDFGLSEMNYRKALMLRPDYVPARDGLKSVLAKQGKPAEKRW